METRINYLAMIDQETSTNWPDVAKILGGALLPFTLVWRFIDKYFKEKSEERVSLISDVAEKTAKETVKEAMREFLAPIQKQIADLTDKIDHNNETVNKRIDDYLRNKLK